MKKYSGNSNRAWKSEMVCRWVSLALMYQRLRERPTFKLWSIVAVEFVRIVIRILIKKLLELLFDNI